MARVALAAKPAHLTTAAGPPALATRSQVAPGGTMTSSRGIDALVYVDVEQAVD